MTWLNRIASRLPGVTGLTALVSAASARERTSFDRLVSIYTPQLRGFIALRMGSGEVDDLAQEIWMTCWTRLPALKSPKSFKAWLYGIAVNKCHEARRARPPVAAPLEDVENVAAAALPMDESVALKDSVRRSLDALPIEQRDVIELYYYSQLTLPEIADALTRNLNTVKYQFYRAHDSVAALITKMDADERVPVRGSGR